jgi:hypothetical protein
MNIFLFIPILNLPKLKVREAWSGLRWRFKSHGRKNRGGQDILFKWHGGFLGQETDEETPGNGASSQYYSFFQVGLRFSRKAVRPSIASWVFMTFSR